MVGRIGTRGVMVIDVGNRPVLKFLTRLFAFFQGANTLSKGMHPTLATCKQ